MARTLNDCLEELRRGGALNDAEFERIRSAFEERRAQHRLALGDDEAARRAAAELEADMAREAAEARRRAALTVAAQSRLKETLQTFRRGDGKPDINEAAIREVQRIEHRAHAIEGLAKATIADFLDTTRKRAIAGIIRNKALIDDVVRAWHGDANVSQEARDFAGALDQTFEWLRQRYNDAGGDMGKLENYGGPHYHDARALRAAGRDTWIETIMPRLDPEKTGMAINGRPWSDAELRAALPRMFETITTEGWNDRQPSMLQRSRSFAARNAEHRMLHFKSGDDWLAYNRDFGTGEPFHAIMHGITRRARDIAAMEVLGPNPDGMVNWLQQVMVQQGALSAAGRPSFARKTGDPEMAAQYTGARVRDMWDNLRGQSTSPVSSAAEIFGTLRSIGVAAKLGGAMLSAFGDLGTSRFARSFNAIGGSVLADQVNYLATYKWSQAEALRTGLIFDSANRVFEEQARYVKGWATRDVADWLADRTLAMSGLTPWTNAARHTFGFGFFGEVADQAGKPFNELPEHLRKAFERHGMNATDWNVIRAAEVHLPEYGMQAGFIRPTDVARIADGPALPRLQQILGLNDQDAAERLRQAQRGAQEVATKYLEMVLNETEYAVPTTTVRARTIIPGNTQPGTVPGEILRSMQQFKTWPMVFSLLWGQRIADQLVADKAGGSWHNALYGRGMVYATGLMLTMTMFGALSTQLKNIRAGRDPESMDPSSKEGRKFWAASIATGGGAGILSDFIFADHNRFGGSLGSTIMGPTGGDIERTLRLVFGPVQAKSDEKDSKFSRDLIKLVQEHAPGGNIWYLDVAAKRLLWDNMQRIIDPEAEKAFARQVQSRRKERNQEFFWAPGESAPARSPDLGAMLGN